MMTITARINASTVAKNIRAGAAMGLRQTAEEMMAASKRLVPVDTGTLKGSGTVGEVETDGRGVMSIKLGYGGPAEPYAVIQHEDLSLNHPGGGQAKFLEVPVNAMAGNLTTNVSNAIRGMI